MTTKIKTENITLLPYNERVKLVRERLNNLRRPTLVEFPKSAKVLAAEKVVEEWRLKNEAHERAQRDAWADRLHEVQDALIVGDMQKALILMRGLRA